MLSAFSVALYFYVTVFAVSLSQVSAGHPDQGKCCPLPPDLPMSFVDVPVFRETLDNSIYFDVISHCKEAPFSGQSRSTNAHENTHVINNVLRNTYTQEYKTPFNGFYILDGKGVIIAEPKIKKSFVNHFVPENLRS